MLAIQKGVFGIISLAMGSNNSSVGASRQSEATNKIASQPCHDQEPDCSSNRLQESDTDPNSLRCMHCYLTLPNIEEWFFHYCKMPPILEQLRPPPSMNLPSSISQEHADASLDFGDSGSTVNAGIVTSQSLPFSQKTGRTSRRAAKQKKWASIKEEVHQLYVLDGKTLQATMSEIEKRHSFKASLRKWKMQVKEWKFDKNMSKTDMAILVAKAEKRARDEGKETTFYCRGEEISSGKIAYFKKRKVADDIVASPSAATPLNIEYDTPRHHVDLDDIEEEDVMTTPTDDHRMPTESRTSNEATFRGVTAETAYGGSMPGVEGPCLVENAGKVLSSKRTSRECRGHHRWLEQLAHHLDLALVCLKQRRSESTAQKMIISALLEHISRETPPLPTYLCLHRGGPGSLTALCHQWLAATLLQHFSNEPLSPETKEANLSRIIHEIRLRLLASDQYSNLGHLQDFKLAGTFIGAAMICQREFPDKVLEFLNKIITQAIASKGNVADSVHFLALLCRALHFSRQSDDGACRNDLKTAWKLLNEMGHGMNGDTLKGFWNTAHQRLE